MTNFKQMHRGVTANLLRYVLPGWDNEELGNQVKASQLYYDPIYINEGRTFTRIAYQTIGVTAVGVAIRIGLYDSVDGYPTNLLLDAGLITISTPGIKEFIIALPLAPGYYYTAGLNGVGFLNNVCPLVPNTTGSPVSPSGPESSLGTDINRREYLSPFDANQITNGLTDPAPRAPMQSGNNHFGVYLGYVAGFEQ